ITCGRVAKPRWTVIGPARLESRRVESIDLSAALGRERRVLFDAMGVKAVNPENRVIGTIADAIRPVDLGNLRDPSEPERAQNYIVKGGGASDVRDTDTCVIDHCNTLNRLARLGSSTDHEEYSVYQLFPFPGRRRAPFEPRDSRPEAISSAKLRIPRAIVELPIESQEAA